jgi:hypothetical protein
MVAMIDECNKHMTSLSLPGLADTMDHVEERILFDAATQSYSSAAAPLCDRMDLLSRRDVDRYAGIWAVFREGRS